MNVQTKKALVTGGAGFIGSHLVDALVLQGWEVVVLDDLSTGKRENLASVLHSITFIEGSVTDFSVVSEAVRGVTHIFHQAAIASVQKSVEDPKGTHAINVGGTENVFKAAHEAGVQRVVYASSSAVYGNDPALPKREDMEKAPVSPYASHKSENEEIAIRYAVAGVSSVGLRYFNVFGPRQDPSSPYSGVISIFVNRLTQKEGVTIFGDGETTRDFVYVADVVDANIMAAEAENVWCEVFNVGTGVETSLNTLVKTLGDVLEVSPNVTYALERAGDVKHSVADVSKIQRMLGWSAQTPFKEGIQNLLEFE